MADDNTPDEGETTDETPANDTTPDVEDSAAAKVEVLMAELAAKDATIADLTAQVTAAKAANYDLLMQIPGTTPATPEPDESDETDVDIDDLFGED